MRVVQPEVYLPAEGLWVPTGSMRAPASDRVAYDEDAFVVPVVRRVRYAFDGRANGAVQRVVLGSGVDATAWSTGALVVLAHQKNAWLTSGGGDTTAQLVVAVESVSLSPEEPDVEYVDMARDVATSPAVLASTVAPLYQVTALAQPFGPQLRVVLRFTQGAAAAASVQTVDLSVRLVGRRG